MPGSEADTSSLDASYLRERLQWLVRLRWAAILSVIAVVAAAHLLGVLGDTAPQAIVVLALGGANTAYLLWDRLAKTTPPLKALERAAFAQIAMDLLALTALLHWSDGIENPFAMIFAFHAAIGARLLPRRGAWLVAGLAVILQCGVVLAEHLGLLAHHPFVLGPRGVATEDPVIGSGLFTTAYMVAFALTMFGIAYFMVSMAHQYRGAQARRAQMEKLAASRARLAHLGELSTGIAHSIRNPLQGLLSCVDILRAELPSSGGCSETLALMEEGLRRIELLTQRLLTFARDEPGQLRRVELGELVDDALRFVHPRNGADQAPSLGRVGGPRVEAFVDPDRICEALVNVLDNAFDACADGGSVSVAVAAPGDRSDMACIEVRDTGSGIAPEHLDRVLDPFFTTKSVGEGTGLGLAITRRIVEDHGGWVEVAPLDEGGTQVRIHLPVRQAARNVLGRES